MNVYYSCSQPQLPVEGSADHEDGGQADEKPDLLGREAKPHGGELQVSAKSFNMGDKVLNG